MRSTWMLWLLALSLKFAGASWDVSWHFRSVRETISGPHLLNGLGELLFIGLFVHEWRRRTPERTMPLHVTLAGMLVWAAAVPFDEAWHRMYGLDLTTWSPSHLMLFYGTATMVAGLVLLFLVDRLGWRPGRTPDLARAPLRDKAVLALLVLFVAEAVFFPLAYNEHTAVAVETAQTAPDDLDPAILEMALTVPDPYFHGTPRWLYPVYCVGAVALIAVLARRALGGVGWTAAVLGGYALVRFSVDAALGAASYPQSVVPWQYVVMAVAWEAAWLLPARTATQVAVGVVLSTGVAYAYWGRIQEVTLAVPVSSVSWPAGLLAAVGAAALGSLLWDLAMTTPSPEPWGDAARRRWADAQATARAFVARWR